MGNEDYIEIVEQAYVSDIIKLVNSYNEKIKKLEEERDYWKELAEPKTPLKKSIRHV